MSSLDRSAGSFMFGDQQMTVLADYIQAALMLKYIDAEVHRRSCTRSGMPRASERVSACCVARGGGRVARRARPAGVVDPPRVTVPRRLCDLARLASGCIRSSVTALGRERDSWTVCSRQCGVCNRTRVTGRACEGDRTCMRV